MSLWIRSQDKKQLSCNTCMQINEHYDDDIHKKANKAYESFMDCLKSGGISRDYSAVKRNAEWEKQKVYDNAKTVFSIMSDDGILGSYSSEARALEILDEIQGLLSPQPIITSCGCDYDVDEIINKLDDSINIAPKIENMKIEPLSFVYQMPKE